MISNDEIDKILGFYTDKNGRGFIVTIEDLQKLAKASSKAGMGEFIKELRGFFYNSPWAKCISHDDWQYLIKEWGIE